MDTNGIAAIAELGLGVRERQRENRGWRSQGLVNRSERHMELMRRTKAELAERKKELGSQAGQSHSFSRCTCSCSSYYVYSFSLYNRVLCVAVGRCTGLRFTRVGNCILYTFHPSHSANTCDT